MVRLLATKNEFLRSGVPNGDDYIRHGYKLDLFSNSASKERIFSPMKFSPTRVSPSVSNRRPLEGPSGYGLPAGVATANGRVKPLAILLSPLIREFPECDVVSLNRLEATRAIGFVIDFPTLPPSLLKKRVSSPGRYVLVFQSRFRRLAPTCSLSCNSHPPPSICLFFICLRALLPER